jgi:hypothetical protein
MLPGLSYARAFYAETPWPVNAMVTKRYAALLDGFAERMQYTGKSGTLLFLGTPLYVLPSALKDCYGAL